MCKKLSDDKCSLISAKGLSVFTVLRYLFT